MTYRRIRLGQIGHSKVIHFAVQELVSYLKQMDRELVIDVLQTTAIQTSFGHIIWVGIDDRLADDVPKVERTDLDDAIAIQVEQGHGYITGSNERSVLLAAYRFLKELGCEWVRPGKEGERIPRKNIENVNVSIRETASYRHRGVCIEGADTYENVFDMIDYLPKVGMNEYFMQFLVPKAFFERWYHHEANPYFEEEPISREEVQAMVNSLEQEISKRGISYHKTGHGWTCEPFGIDGTSWDGNSHYEVTKEIKECLAEVDGKREFWNNIPLNTQLCYSNPKVRDKMTDAITDYCKKNPHVDVLHFWLADDGNNHCECTECAKKCPADWYMILLNELDVKLSAAKLNTRIVFLIYEDLLWEPKQEKLENPERFILMFAPINRIYGQNYSDHLSFDEELPPYIRNQIKLPDSLAQNLAHLRRWQTGFAGDSFAFEYHLMWAHVNDPGYEYCARNLYDDVRDLRVIGLNGMMSCQVQRSFFPTGLPFYMMAAALWNRECDYETKVNAYYQAAYGEDGTLVHQYLKTISEQLLLYEGPATARGCAEMNQKQFCRDYAEVRGVITAFREIIQRNLVKEEDAVKEEWKLLQMHHDYISELVSILELKEQNKEREAKMKLYALLDTLCRNELRLQKTMDIHNAFKCLRRRLKLI